MPEPVTHASLKGYNTFGLDVYADRFVPIATLEEAREVLQDERFRQLPRLVLGGGSNILFTRDFHGLVVLNLISGISVIREDDTHVFVRAGAGENWHHFVRHTVEHGWGGLENLSLIPGTVGAAPIQNIGAYGVEIKDTFNELEALDLSDGSTRTFSAADCAFGYRDSIFKGAEKGRYLITHVTFRLAKKPVINTRYGAIEQELKEMGVANPGIREVSEAVIRIRRSKLPDPAMIGNAGSFFKNPEVPEAVYHSLKASYPDLPGYNAGPGRIKLAAGYLIEKCGWKGKVVGHVGMHEKQALVLVNHGGATGSELIEHARRVQTSVVDTFGVELEMEVNIL
ncbi:MAG: UDP-N-acetylenolpyruvoylglucosamine reductase [Bacteroidota bacterium]